MIVAARQVSVRCDKCGEYGPAARTAVEARALAILEGWKVNARRAVLDLCDCCQDPR